MRTWNTTQPRQPSRIPKDSGFLHNPIMPLLFHYSSPERLYRICRESTASLEAPVASAAYARLRTALSLLECIGINLLLSNVQIWAWFVGIHIKLSIIIMKQILMTDSVSGCLRIVAFRNSGMLMTGLRTSEVPLMIEEFPHCRICCALGSS